jgi:hypothetical protein
LASLAGVVLLVAALVAIALAPPTLGSPGTSVPRGVGVRAIATTVRPTTRPQGDGTSNVSSVPNDWSWERWSTGVGPSPRYEPVLVDDPAEHGVLLFGGTSLTNSAILNDTWLFRAGVWTELCTGSSSPPSCPTSPSPRVASEVAYDPARSAVVLFSGAKSFSDPDDTWLFVNGSWQNVTTSRAPPPDDSLPIATSPNGTVLLVSSSSHGAETWEYGSSGWYEISTGSTPRVGDLQPMWFDANLDSDILWDQASGTWEFSGTSWTLLTEAVSPPNSGGLPEGAGFDSSFGYGFLYAPTASDRSTWAFAEGAWTNVTANVSLGPPTTNPLGVTYDSSDGYVVAVEDTGTQTSDISTWILHDPFTLRLNDSWPLRDIGQTTYFGITEVGGVSPYDVTVEQEPAGCGPPSNLSNQSTVECVLTRTGSASLRVLARDSRFLYLSADLGIGVNATLGASADASPNPTVVAHAVTFSATISGGTTPYNVTWQIPGRGTRTGVETSASVSAPGSEIVNLTVSDAALATWNVTFPVDVLAGLGVTGSANVSVTDVGYPVAFSSVETGGVSASPVNWSFGDGQNASGGNVTHTYVTSGNFSVKASAQDALGETVSVPVPVTVHPKLSVQPGPYGTSIPVAGEPVELSAGIVGGTPPFEVTWTYGGGGGGSNATPVTTFTNPGPVTVQVTVTDAVGARAVGSVTLTVGPANGPGASGGSGGTNTAGEAEFAAILLVGAVVAALVWVLRRRRASA